MTSEAPAAHWRAAVDGIMSGVTAEEAVAAPARLTPIALLFELRHLVRRDGEAWRAPTGRRVTAATVAEEDRRDYRLGTRPVVPGRGGSWSRSVLTWTSLNHQTHRLALDPAHQRWFAEFAALYRATRTVHLGQDPDWVLLDDYESPLLWNLLEQAPGLGIGFRSAGGGAVVVEAGAAVLLDARRDPTDGALVLRPEVRLGDGPHPPVASAAMADHGLYGYSFEAGEVLRLGRLARPLDDEERRLLLHPLPTRIPAADEAEFLGHHLPRLRARVAVASGDDSIALPAVRPPVLVCTASFEPRGVLRVSWRWERQVDRVDDAAAVLGARENALLARARSVTAQVGVPEVVAGAESLLRGADAAAFGAEVLPRLEEIAGITVEREGAVPDYRRLSGDVVLRIAALDTPSADWFELGFTVTIGSTTVPFAPLFSALARGEQRLLLPDRSYLPLDHPGLDRLRELLERADELDEWDTGELRLGRHDTAVWAELAELADTAEASDAWRGVLDSALAAGASEAVDPPAGLAATLRPYQREGLAWLAHRLRHGLGGVLADDMGLGKTLQTLAMIVHAEESPRSHAGGGRPYLVVAPTSVVHTWQEEARRFAPDLVVHAVTSTRAGRGRSLAEAPPAARLVVTSYAVLRLAADDFAARSFAAVVLDEAQFVKNPAARTHRAVRALDAPVVLALTGTPVENGLDELWSLFALVAPGLLGPLARFREHYTRPVEHLLPGEDAASARNRLDVLRRRIRPFLLRRTKAAVAPDLPEKQEQTLEVTLSPAHRVLYDSYLQRERRKLLGLVDDLDRQRFTVFRSLTLLRMLALHPGLVDPAYAHVGSAKIDVLVDQLHDVVAEGRRSLVFSSFTSFLDRVGASLERAGIPFVRLDGSTRDRAAVVESFRSGTGPVFLISLKAGGSGLTLTEADHVVVLDPWWNPAAEAQAVDRAHRIGQERRVNVYRFVAADTIEERIMRLKARKVALVDAVLDEGDAFAAALSADDIRELLAE